MRWRLLNGEARNAESPDTFEIPGLAERQSLRPGQHVKLMFEFATPDGPKVERMWVKVEQALLGGYRGVLDNKPLHDGSLKLGAKVEFRPEHVISIHDSTH